MVSPEERQMFTDIYRYYEKYNPAPPDDSPQADLYWDDAFGKAVELSNKHHSTFFDSLICDIYMKLALEDSEKKLKLKEKLRNEQ